MIEMHTCPCCNREVKDQDMTIHHIIPKSKGGTLDDTIYICQTCHRYLHYCIPMKSVYKYDSVEALEMNKEYSRYLVWIRSKTHSAQYNVKQVRKKLDRYNSDDLELLPRLVCGV